MSEESEIAGEAAVGFSRRHGVGCLALGAFSLAGAALCIVLGVGCLDAQDFFACVGLLTIFPLAFAAIGLVSLAVGFQRFTTAGRAAATGRPASGLGAAWQTYRVSEVAPRPRIATESVIQLPGAVRPEDGAEAHPDRGESDNA